MIDFIKDYVKHVRTYRTFHKFGKLKRYGWYIEDDKLCHPDTVYELRTPWRFYKEWKQEKMWVRVAKQKLSEGFNPFNKEPVDMAKGSTLSELNKIKWTHGKTLSQLAQEESND